MSAKREPFKGSTNRKGRGESFFFGWKPLKEFHGSRAHNDA